MHLPLRCEEIPSTVTSLAECALHEVRSLMKKSHPSQEEEDALDDGFVLCDLSVIHKKLRVWRSLFPRVKPFFALKCNPDVMVAAVLGQQSSQAGFDCASLPEIRLALASANKNGRLCIYANPQRAEADLEAALSMGIEALTFDGAEELHKVYAAHKKKSNGTNTPPPEMILRILVPDTTSSVPLGEKFGASLSRVEPLVREAMDLGLSVVGVSFHCGSGCHDAHAYANAIRLAKDAMDTINRVQSHPPCRLLDIGGGFPGSDGAGGDNGRFSGKSEDTTPCSSANEVATSEIAAVVSPLLDELFPECETSVQFIAEPGRYFVVSCANECVLRQITHTLETHYLLFSFICFI